MPLGVEHIIAAKQTKPRIANVLILDAVRR